jgi:hypothetical protein
MYTQRCLVIHDLSRQDWQRIGVAMLTLLRHVGESLWLMLVNSNREVIALRSIVGGDG